MRRLLFALVLVGVLVLVPAAGAKRLTRLVIVGADGRSVELIGEEQLAPWRWSDRVATAPTDGYLLLYPLFDARWAGQPARYYPSQRIACFSWNRSAVGECRRIPEAAAARLAPATSLSRFVGESTTLAQLELGGSVRRLESNEAVAIELVLNRPRLARPATRPPTGGYSVARAEWRGPDASSRPASFLWTSAGAWLDGRLYPLQGLPYRCDPPSPTSRTDGFNEIRGSVRRGQLWALAFGPPAEASAAVFDLSFPARVKIVWRMTTASTFRVAAVSTDGAAARVVAGPTRHTSSNWRRPGYEWGTHLVFPEPGCWRLRAISPTATGEIWVLLR